MHRHIAMWLEERTILELLIFTGRGLVQNDRLNNGRNTIGGSFLTVGRGMILILTFEWMMRTGRRARGERVKGKDLEAHTI